MGDIKKQQKCKLLPYKKRYIISAQEARQRIGWGISAFKVNDIWNSSQGEGVVIGVIDTGCDLNHKDIKNNLLPGINIVEPDKEPQDDNSHGCHVTGIICAENNDFGVVGVAPKAKVRPIKVLDGYGDGEIKNVVKGIRWAIEQKVDIICMSLGTIKPIASLRKAIKAADAAGIPLIVAAGNMGESEHLLYPANYPETISVGSITKDLNRSEFSNTGKNLDFLAPGSDILSTVPGNQYAIMSGTSMAAPFVCGLAALLLSYKRQFGLNEELHCANDYREYFKNHTVKINCEEYAGNKSYQGYGIISVKNLID